MNFGIVITTYQRRDGRTPFLIKRAINSIFNQTYTNFKIYVIGDKYEDNDEFINLFSEYPFDKIYFENLPFAKERDIYTEKALIWAYAGCYANNYGIEKALSDGLEYICHLDHDDEWENNHLSSIKNCIDVTGADWVCTKSKHIRNSILPSVKTTEDIIEFMPAGGKVIHSSVCMNFKKIPLRHRNLYEETGKLSFPGDYDFWERTRKYMEFHKLKACLVNKITCIHLEEGFERF